MQETYLHVSPVLSVRVQVKLELLCVHDFQVHASQNCGSLKHQHCQKNGFDINGTINSTLHFKLRCNDLQCNLNTINQKDTLLLCFFLLSPFLPMLWWHSVAMSIMYLFQNHVQDWHTKVVKTSASYYLLLLQHSAVPSCSCSLAFSSCWDEVVCPWVSCLCSSDLWETEKGNRVLK